MDLSGWSDTGIGSYSDTMEGAFSGHFNGNGHTVKYGVNGAAGSQGLFPCLNGAVVQNLTVAVSHTSSKDVATGALVSRAQNSVIKGINVEHTFIKGSDTDLAASGLSALNVNTKIENCRVVEVNAPVFSNYGGIAVSSSGTITGSEYVMAAGETALSDFGGIARTNSGTIKDCNVYLPAGGIAAAGNVGGICSILSGGVVQDCYSVFHTESGGNNLGGVVADMQSGTVIGCTVTGKIIGGNRLGGIAGRAVSSGEIAIKSCTVEVSSIGSSVTGASFNYGGLIGYLDVKTSVIENCTSSADIYAGTDSGGMIGGIRLLSGYSFSLKDSACYGEEIKGQQGCGGMIGALDVPEGNTAGVSGLIANCETRMNVLATGAYNGGFIGFFSAYGFTITDCKVYGDVQSNETHGGGFIGRASFVAGTTLIENCVSTGSVAGGGILGGFAGYLEGAGKIRFTNCNAFGIVTATGSSAGGFIGYNGNTGLTVTACSAGGSVSGDASIGGFIGLNLGKDSSFGGSGELGCSATGDVTARNAGGGFIGRSSGENSTWQNCSASGSLINVSSESGGFAGVMASSVISNCISYGDCLAADAVSSTAVGGFIGNTWNDVGEGHVQKNVVINNCVSYGNITSASSQVGGFVGEFGSVNRDSMTNCVSYGTVTSTGSFVGGFVGNLIEYSSFIGCYAYGGTVSGKSSVGGFLGFFSTAKEQHNLSGNKYRTALPAAGNSAAVTEAEAKRMISSEVKVPPAITVEMSASGNGTLLTVSFSGASGYSVRDLAISTDGGKYYTDLVSGSVRHVNIDQAALNNCGNFTYVYAAEYLEANTVITITITNGDTEITKIFKKRV